MEINKILHGDCIELMSKIPNGSIDMILCDLPYGNSQNKWDVIIPLDKMWNEYLRVIKPNGAIVLTAVQIFASQLVMSQPKLFKYDWIWKKTVASGQLNVNRMPLRTHEHILVFYQKQPTYNQQFTKGESYKIHRKVTYNGRGYNEQKDTQKDNNGFRHPTSVLEFSNPRISGGHPTQKPLPLFEYLIKTYTNKDEIVLDNCIGAGTTAIAALNTQRKFIGMEISEKYVEMAKNRILKWKNGSNETLDNRCRESVGINRFYKT